MKTTLTRLSAAGAACLGLVAGAFAQTAGETAGGGATLDLSGSVNAAKDTLVDFLTTNMPSLFGLMMVCLCVGIGWKLLKRGSKAI